jgi:hypothetical protein
MHMQIAAILARTRQSAEASSVTSSGYVTPTSGTANFSALNFSNVLNAASPSSTPNMAATPTGTGTLQIQSGVFADFAKSIRTLNIDSDSDNDGDKARSTLSNSQALNLSDVRAAAAAATERADRYAQDSDTEEQQQQQQQQQYDSSTDEQQHTDDLLVLAEQSLNATADNDDDLYKHSESDSYNRAYEQSDANDDTFESESHDANTAAALNDHAIQQQQQQQQSTGIAAATDSAVEQFKQHRYDDNNSDSDNHSASGDAVTGRVSMQYRIASDNDEPDTLRQQQQQQLQQQQQQQQQLSKRFNEFIESPKQSAQHDAAVVDNRKDAATVDASAHKQSDSAAVTQPATTVAQQQHAVADDATQQATASTADGRHSVDSSTHKPTVHATDTAQASVISVQSSSAHGSSSMHGSGSNSGALQQQQAALLQSPAQSVQNSSHVAITGYESPVATTRTSTENSIGNVSERVVVDSPPPPPPIDDDYAVADDSIQQQQQQQQQQRVRVQQQRDHSSSSSSSSSSDVQYQRQQQQYDGYSGLLGIAAASAVTWDVPTKVSSFKELQLQLQRLQQVSNNCLVTIFSILDCHIAASQCADRQAADLLLTQCQY